MGKFTVKSELFGSSYRFASVALGSCLAVSGLVAQDFTELKKAETQRRVELTQEAKKRIAIGDTAYEAGSYGESVSSYKRAMGLLTNAKRTKDLYDAVNTRYAQAAVEYSKQLNREGKYEEAQELLGSLLSNSNLKEDPLVQAADAKLNDPIRNNPSATAKHAVNVDKVRRLLYKAQGAYNLGNYDEANEKYNAILLIDKTNQAARRGQQRVHREIAAYGRAAHDESRSRLLNKVEKQWEMQPVPDYFIGSPVIVGDEGNGVSPINVQRDLRQRLSKIMIPKVNFEETTIDSAITRFKAMLNENSAVKGVDGEINILLNLGGELNTLGVEIRKQKFDLSVRNIPADNLLDLICKQSNTEWTADQFKITILPNGQLVDRLFTRTFNVPPNFLDRPIDSNAGGGNSLFGEEGIQRTNFTVVDYLKQLGVTFPEGASASYISNMSLLSVTNTPRNMRAISKAIQALKMTQNVIVNVRVRVIDVLQDDLEELGYDWLLAPNRLQNGTSGLWVGGGNTGNGIGSNPIQLDGLPSITRDALTSGLRSGNNAFASDSIDARLSAVTNLDQVSQAEVGAPGILQATAFLNDSHVQVILKGLNQKKGSSRVWSPSVSTMPGQRARLEQVRQFIYPTEYDPPDIPDAIGNGGGVPPIVPATPTAFEERPVGVILDVEPVVDPQRRHIALDIEPEFSEFLGFVDYGSPILMVGTNPITGLPVTQDYTPNSILMPVFENIKTKSSITIADGATVALAGVSRMEVSQVNDRVPVISSLPFVGDFFKSNGTKTVKRAIVIFASAELVDPTGRKWRDINDDY